MPTSQTTWDSLEIAKLVVSMLTPLAILFLGIWTQRLTKRFEEKQWFNQKIIEKRLSIYEEVSPLTNDLYCYFMWRGSWKEFTPPDIIKLKRRLDKIVYINAFLFSSDFRPLYKAFEYECFATYMGTNLDALLRTPIASIDGDRRQVSPIPWQPQWDKLFSDESAEFEDDHKQRIEDTYKQFLSNFAKELGVIQRKEEA